MRGFIKKRGIVTKSLNLPKGPFSYVIKHIILAPDILDLENLDFYDKTTNYA